MAHVFISYKSEDHEFAFELKQRIEDTGFSTWIDKDWLRAGEDWREEIEDAIKNSFAMILIMTPKAAESKFVIYEFAFAWALGVKVIPIMHKRIELRDFHPRLEGRQYEDLQKAEVSVKLSTQLRKLETTYSSRDAIRRANMDLSDSDPHKRTNAIRTLGQMKGGAAREALAEAVHHDIQDVRFDAAFELARLKDSRALPGILEALYGQTSYDLQHQPALSLANLGNEGMPGLINLLEHQNAQLRYLAAQMLGQTGFLSSQSVPPLINILLNDPDGNMRSAAAHSLGEIGDKTATESLQIALKDDVAGVRENAATALGKLGDSKAVSGLKAALTDKYTNVIRAVVTALRRIGTEEALSMVEPYRDAPQYWEEFI
jgi:TIR domain-containing protein/HEAT repeat protein